MYSENETEEAEELRQNRLNKLKSKNLLLERWESISQPGPAAAKSDFFWTYKWFSDVLLDCFPIRELILMETNRSSTYQQTKFIRELKKTGDGQCFYGENEKSQKLNKY